MDEYPLDDVDSFWAGKLPAGVNRVFRSDTIPEQCPWCKHEFDLHIQATVPPSLSAKCACGWWLIQIVE